MITPELPSAEPNAPVYARRVPSPLSEYVPVVVEIVADHGTTWEVNSRLGTTAPCALVKFWQITLMGVPSAALGIGIAVPCFVPVTVPALEVIVNVSFTSNVEASAETEIVP
jgi:hypothetical protein